MANWTPEGFIGQLFKITSQHAPPPPMPSPLLWGNEAIARERLRERFTRMLFTRRNLIMAFPMTPAASVEYFREWYGPTQRAFATLDETGQAALRRDLERLWTEHNFAKNGTTCIAAEYLEVIATRA